MPRSLDSRYSDETKKSISQKCSSYLDRLEALQTWFREHQSKSDNDEQILISPNSLNSSFEIEREPIQNVRIL